MMKIIYPQIPCFVLVALAGVDFGLSVGRVSFRLRNLRPRSGSLTSRRNGGVNWYHINYAGCEGIVARPDELDKSSESSSRSSRYDCALRDHAGEAGGRCVGTSTPAPAADCLL